MENNKKVLPAPLKALNDAKYSIFHQKIIIILSIGAFVDLYLIGNLGASTFSIIPFFLHSTSNFAFTASLLFLGSAFGVLSLSPLVDKFGRRSMIIIPLALMALFSVFSAVSQTPLELNLSRFILGFAAGAYYPSAMSMVTEYMPAKYHGRGISYLWVAFTLGGTVAYLLGYILYSTIGSTSIEWRIVLLSAVVPAFIGLLFSFKIAESARWLIEKNKVKEAIATIKNATGITFSSEDIELSRDYLFKLNKDNKLGKTNKKYLKKYILLIIPISLAVLSFNLITGALATLNPTILSALHISKGKTYLFSAAFLGVQVISTLIIARTIDTVGRLRWALIGGAFETLFSLTVIVIYHNPIALIGVFTGIFFFSYIAIPVMNNSGSELFPTEFRGFSSGVVMFGNRIASVIGLLITPLLFSGDDVLRLFGVYGIIGVFGTFMAYLGLRGRKIDKQSLEEIIENFADST